MGKNSFVAEVTFKFTMTVISKAHNIVVLTQTKVQIN